MKAKKLRRRMSSCKFVSGCYHALKMLQQELFVEEEDSKRFAKEETITVSHSGPFTVDSLALQDDGPLCADLEVTQCDLKDVRNM